MQLPNKSSPKRALERVFIGLAFALSVSTSFSFPLTHETRAPGAQTSFDIFTLYPIKNEQDTGFNKRDFSRFKWGDQVVTEQYGGELAEMVWTRIIKPLHAKERQLNKPLTKIVSMSARGNLPTAASALETYFVKYLNRYLARAMCHAVSSVAITRTLTPNVVNYATMSDHERLDHMTTEHFHFDHEAVAGKLILVIDDMRVTGAYEAALRRMFMRADSQTGDLSNVIYVYLTTRDNFAIDPMLEHRLNEAAVPTLADYKPIIESPRFMIENGLVRRMLEAQPNEVNELIDSLHYGVNFVRKLYDAAISNDYHLVGDIYAVNLELLRRRAQP